MSSVQNQPLDRSRGTVLITGANGSLGLSFVECLLQYQPSYNAVLTVRDDSPQDQNTQKLRAIVAKFPEANILIKVVDLGNLASVRTFADSIQALIKAETIPPITALICNAFSWSLLGVKFSHDNYELGFQVSHLSHFLLVLKLLGSMNAHVGRIVFLGSEAHDSKNKNAINPLGANIPKDLEELVHPPEDKKGEESKRGFQRYGNSKLANVMFMLSLNDKIARNPDLQDIKVLAMDPGGMPTSRAFRQTPFLIRTAMFVAGHVILPFTNTATSALKTTEASAQDLYMLSIGSDAADLAGYFVGQKPTPSSEDSQNKQLQEELWLACNTWAGFKHQETIL